ncbi:MAG: mechanosensitive ion channel family protein [Halieaceae bacterium]|nr:mechanosensitive ion channel family protein [Halieaceae bacterium]
MPLPSFDYYRLKKQLLTSFSLLLLLPAITLSQDSSSPDVSMRDVLESEQRAEQLVQEKEQSDPEAIAAANTPLASLLGLRKAMQNLDYEKAGDFLDMRYLSEDMDSYSKEGLIRALSHVWGQQNIIDIGAISDDPEGNLNDGLPSYRDKIGSVVISSGEVPIYLQRIPDGRGGKVWKLSNSTVADIPRLWEELGYGPVAIYFSELLPDISFMGMSNWQLAATLLSFILAWPAAVVVSNLVMRLALLVPNRFPKGIEHFFQGAMRFFIFIAIARLLVDQLGLSLTARILLDSSGVDYVAYTVLLLGTISLLRDYQVRRLQAAGNAHFVALLKPLTTMIKLFLVMCIALFWADSAGYNMSTILAGLGVGSLAVALAAQKTLENLIGAITLYAARPVNPGDFCRFGTVVGTIEEIGLRSTTIRTLNRTLVFIPNSVFSSAEVENYSARERIRFFRDIQLHLVNADQLRFVLAQLRRLFLAHPEVIQDTVSVRFTTIDGDSAHIRIDAGISTTDFQVYLAIAEDLNLRVVETVNSAGAQFTGPGQILQVAELAPADSAQKELVEATLQAWRDQDKLPFPNYSDSEIRQFKGSLDYPPAGAQS